jgi:hypothetical protein
VRNNTIRPMNLWGLCKKLSRSVFNAPYQQEVTVQGVLLLSLCLSAIWFMYFVLCYVRINYCKYFSIYIFYLFSWFLCFAFHFVCSVFLYCFVYCFCPCIQLFISYLCKNFTDHCHRVDTKLQSINVSNIIREREFENFLRYSRRIMW